MRPNGALRESKESREMEEEKKERRKKEKILGLGQGCRQVFSVACTE